MRFDRLSRPASLSLGLAVMFVWSITGCGGSDTTTAKVTPEAQQKTEVFLKDYQKSMFDQHKGKATTKKAK